MLFEKIKIAKASGTEVASAVQYFVDNELEGHYYILVVEDDFGNEEEIRIRPMYGQDFILSPGGTQIIKCMAKDGRRVDLLIPEPNLRHGPAGVIIGSLPDEKN